MSEPQISDPVAQPNGPGEMLKHSLLESELPEHKSTPDLQGVEIAAESISMMAKRPIWLPEDWKIRLGVRSSGATAGQIDQYYIGPSGYPRLRSKNEVLCFLETGSKKRKSTSEADGATSNSPGGLPKKFGNKYDVPKTLPKKLRMESKKAGNVSNKSDDVLEMSEERSDDSSETSEDSSETSEDAPVVHDDVQNMQTSTRDNVP